MTLPPHLAYGDEGWPPRVPPGATVEMDIELMGATDPETLRDEAQAAEVHGVFIVVYCNGVGVGDSDDARHGI